MAQSTDSLIARRLRSLGHFNPHGFKSNDANQFRQCISWLEDKKIRFYSLEDRTKLKDNSIQEEEWQQNYEHYLKDLNCPEEMKKSRKTQLIWLTGRAVQIEFAQNPKSYNNLPNEDFASTKKTTNPLDGINVHTDDFKKKVAQLAQSLKVPSHQDHLVTFEACCLVILERLNKAALRNANNKKSQGQKVLLNEHNLGVPPELRNDPGLKQALQILRLLHLKELRELQDEINNTIESVQALTANPKTDTRLGQVGR